MGTHRDHWYTIGGEVMSVRELFPREPAATTPLHAIDSIYGRELFCNPWGEGSEIALEMALAHANRRAQCSEGPSVSLEEVIKVIAGLQSVLESEVAKGHESRLLASLVELKGYPITEVQDNIKTLRRMVDGLEEEGRPLLRAMLGMTDPDHFFATHDVASKYGLVASGNLGLLETVILVWIGILAQAARNGRQFSLTIRPSIYDSLFHDIIHILPEDVRTSFSRITWRSEPDIIPDGALASRLINGLDGALYFGTRSTLLGFRDMVEGNGRNHRFYYDHFPVMILFPDPEPQQITATAQLAATLAYKSRGEACLSLQDVFVHRKAYDFFMTALMAEWRRLRAAGSDLWSADTLLPQYPAAYLEQFAHLRDKLDGAVLGQVYPEKNWTDLIVNHELDLDNWILSTENAAPLLCVAAFNDSESLLQSLSGHLDRSTSDKFIYTLIVAPARGGGHAALSRGLGRLSHRLEVLTSTEDVAGFQAYAPGIPHCGGISFLADIFGLQHYESCYWV